MGKWSTFNIPPGISEKRDELKNLIIRDLTARWEAAGSPQIADYGLRWYWGSSGDVTGWRTLDDSASRKIFRIFCDKSIDMCYWEMIATTAAFELGISRLAVVTDVAPNPVTERGKYGWVPTEDYFSLTSSNFEGHNHRIFKALQPVHFLEEAKLFLIMMGPEMSKQQFISDFITHLIMLDKIMEIDPVVNLQFKTDIETDKVNEDFLNAWLT